MPANSEMHKATSLVPKSTNSIVRYAHRGTCMRAGFQQVSTTAVLQFEKKIYHEFLHIQENCSFHKVFFSVLYIVNNASYIYRTQCFLNITDGLEFGHFIDIDI